jgi:hypothetical protein
MYLIALLLIFSVLCKKTAEKRLSSQQKSLFFLLHFTQFSIRKIEKEKAHFLSNSVLSLSSFHFFFFSSITCPAARKEDQKTEGSLSLSDSLSLPFSSPSLSGFSCCIREIVGQRKRNDKGRRGESWSTKEKKKEKRKSNRQR